MNFLRKLVSLIVLVVSVAALVCLCMDDIMQPVWDSFSDAFSPFDFKAVAGAVVYFMTMAQAPLVLIMMGFIGFCIPKIKKPK